MSIQNLLHSVRKYAKHNNLSFSETIKKLEELNQSTPMSLEKFEVGKKYRLLPEYWGQQIYWTDLFYQRGTSVVFMVERVDAHGNGIVTELYEQYIAGYASNIHWYEEVV